MSQVKLIGYAPDADPTIVGVLTNCSGAVPSIRGMKGAPSPLSVGATVLSGTCIGSALVSKIDGSTRLFAGNTSRIYELSSGSWTDQSSGTYTASSTQHWRFAQFGDVSLACNGSDTIQFSNGSGKFSAIGTAPVAAVIETVGNFVFAADTTDAVYGTRHDGWWCSALASYSSWSPSIATQAANARLTAVSGPITAMRRFGAGIVAYKQKSMYLGVYVGPPVIWEFDLIVAPSGALTQEVVVNIGTTDNPKHIYMGFDDFYLYDGAKPVPIGNNRVKQTVFSQLNYARANACCSVHDSNNTRVYFYYPVSDSPLPDHCVVYNYRTDKWGQDDRQIEAATDYISTGLTYGTLGNSYTTYSSLPYASYGTAFLQSGAIVPAIFDITHTIKSLTGTAENTAITTGDFGDGEQFYTLQRIRPIFLTSPTSSTLTNMYKNNEGDALTVDQITSLDTLGKYDVLMDARWHRVMFSMVGDWEMANFIPDYVPSGFE